MIEDVGLPGTYLLQFSNGISELQYTGGFNNLWPRLAKIGCLFSLQEVTNYQREHNVQLTYLYAHLHVVLYHFIIVKYYSNSSYISFKEFEVVPPRLPGGGWDKTG
jgi:hypothetical protein